MYIGIDLGGTNIAGGLVHKDGSVVKIDSVPTGKERGFEAVSEDILSLIKELMKDAPEPVEGVGVGVPGVVDNNLSMIYYCTNLSWNDKDLGKELGDKLGIPVFIDNDANLAALAEVEAGSLSAADNAVMLTLGTGIGGGVAVDGHILRGSHGLGSEIGHMIIGENFYDCNCGNNGCFETFSSATAVIKYAEKLLEENKYPESVLYEVKNSGDLTAKAVIDAAKAGDALGSDAFDRLVKYLAIGVTNIVNIFDPEMIALGGGVAHTGAYLVERLEEKVKAMSFIKNFPSAKIVLAELGNNAGVIGAAMLAKTEM
ncbi:ROK family protein [Fusibacter sp. JL216-2]|uniref:ROK family protein n=1 Tax=Fusibacter sp. JL216-2 TaxID=3071453 RepID=UPI003D346081